MTRLNINGYVDGLLSVDRNLNGILEKWDLNNFLLELPDKWKLSFFVEVEGKVVAYMICSKKENATHIHRLAVCKEFQGLNIGHNLIRSLENLIRTDESITLKVKKLNRIAIRFYEKNGFVSYGEEDNKYLYRKIVGDEIDKKGTCNECAS